MWLKPIYHELIQVFNKCHFYYEHSSSCLYKSLYICSETTRCLSKSRSWTWIYLYPFCIKDFNTNLKWGSETCMVSVVKTWVSLCLPGALCDKSAPIIRTTLCCFTVWWSEYIILTLTWTTQIKGRQAAQVQPRPVLLQPALPITNHIRGKGWLYPPFLFRGWG